MSTTLLSETKAPLSFCGGESWVVESRILGIGIQNTAQGIRCPTNDWNLESKFPYQRIQNPVPGILNPRCGIHNPRLSWISLHGAISLLLTVLLVSKIPHFIRGRFYLHCLSGPPNVKRVWYCSTFIIKLEKNDITSFLPRHLNLSKTVVTNWNRSGNVWH